MNFTFYLVTATLMAAPPAESPTIPHVIRAKSSAQTGTTPLRMTSEVRETSVPLSALPRASANRQGTIVRPIVYEEVLTETPETTATGRGGFLDRVRNFFFPYSRGISHQVPTWDRKIYEKPVWTDSPTPAKSHTTNYRLPTQGKVPGMTSGTNARPSMDLSEVELKKVGHAPDHSWITGKLFREGGRSGQWVICYAGPYEVDTHGGSLNLSTHPELSNCREGDLVCVHGQVTGSGNTGGTTYQLSAVHLIERDGVPARTPKESARE